MRMWLWLRNRWTLNWTPFNVTTPVSTKMGKRQAWQKAKSRDANLKWISLSGGNEPFDDASLHRS